MIAYYAAAMNLPQALQIAVQHHEAGRLPEAEKIYRQILAAQPSHPDALHFLGLLAQQTGHHDAAATLLHRASVAKTSDADLHALLGASLGITGQREQAIAALMRAIELRPDFADAYNNLANVYRDQGQLDRAMASLNQALSLRPDFYEARVNRAHALLSSHRPADAVPDFEVAVRLRPDDAQLRYHLGVALDHSNQRDLALPQYRKALQLDPKFAQAHFNVAAVLSMGMDLTEAMRHFHEAARLTQLPIARDMILHFQHHSPVAKPHDLFQQHEQWGREIAEPLAEEIQPHSNDRNPLRRLRIGYISADFRRHSVAYFLEPLLAAHDRREVEIFCYADEIRSDAFTDRFRTYADCWRNITGVADADVAQLVRSDAIDILIDLAGHSVHNRLPVFARKPAPVQVSYLGYPDTTGMPTIDYRLTDAIADPPGVTEALHTEQLIRLPGCAWCYRPLDNSPPVEDARATKTLTFGSFSVASKINPPLIELWARLLRELPDARLLIKTGHGLPSLAHPAIRNEFARHGIGDDRLELVGFAPDLIEHLRSYSRVDIALDTFPYNGTTTTCEALWMGVPVISLAGETHASRVGASLLSVVGLPDLVANQPGDYVAIAKGLAQDVARRTQLRRELRPRMQSSPLMDGPRLARSVEQAYRTMWRAYARG
jgi:predicted O-linked N-acetylglucosamine transferase (SPINDLY family)